MPIDAIASASSVPTTPAIRSPKQSMDGDMFLSLLITQLQNQDPSSPMDSNQMIAQSTQLAMMEGITQISTRSDENFSLQMRTSASALVGQTVAYSVDGIAVSGTVTGVSFAGPVPVLTVGADQIPLDAIQGVGDVTLT